MGIQGLTKLIADNTGSAIKENEMKHFFGRKVAIDASMSIYQFLIAVRSGMDNLTNEKGETTSHLMGIFYRTIRMISNGIKPVYVFDGKPPTMKSGELAKRTERRKQAETALSEATEQGNQEDMEKFNRRLVRVTKQHNADCQKLLGLMGVPFVLAPCEAESQCAALCAGGKVYATATEDMDALTFGTNVLLRHMTFSEARKMPIREYHLPRVLAELEMSMAQFIDLCILLGCDYCEKIKGIGPHKALALIREHGCIEEILKHLDPKKYPVSPDWKFAEARALFVAPEVTPADEVELRWTAPDVEGIVQYMCVENGFAEDRIRSSVAKLSKARTGSTQGRLDSFFKVLPGAPSKRKADTKGKGGKGSKAAAAKKPKGKGGFRR